MVEKKRNLENILTCIVFFLMIFSPTRYMNIKTVLFVLLLIIRYFKVLNIRKQIVISRSVAIWFAIYIFSGIFYTFLSYLYSNPDPFNSLNVHAIEPLIYVLWISTLDERDVKFLYNVFLYVALIATIYNMIATMCFNGILIPSSFSHYFITAKANLGGINIGIRKFTSQNLSWLMFLVPMYISHKLTRNNSPRYNEEVLNTVIVLGIVNAVLSMRTAFILCIAMTPLLTAIFSKIYKMKLNWKRIIDIAFLCVIALVVVMLVLSRNISEVIDVILQKVTQSFSVGKYTNSYGINDGGGAIRVSQIKDLINTWAIKPLLGWGDSANSQNIIRSSISAGAYEMTYFAMLMQRGIIGFALFCAQVIWMYFSSRKIEISNYCLKPELFGTLIGLFTFMFANGTNPYLGSFDRLVILFLPLIFINTYELNKRRI